MQIKDLIPWVNHKPAQGDGAGTAHPLAEFQREMNRVFDSFWSDGTERLGASTFGALESDVVETDDAIEVTVEIPGIEEKDIDLTIAPGALTIKGEKKVESQEEKKGYHLSERRYGSFQRVIGLPDGVDQQAAAASFRNGVLKVTLPKLAEAKAQVRKIDIAAG